MDRANAVVNEFRSAALGMTTWLSAAEALAAEWGSHIGQIAVLRQDKLLINVVSGVAADGIDAYYAARGGDPTVNPRAYAALYSRPFVSTTDDEFTNSEMRERPIYTGLFRAFDAPKSIVVPMGQSGDLKMALALMYPKSWRPVDQRRQRLLDHIAPTIKAILTQSIALGTTGETALTITAESLSGPAILLGRDGSVISLSPAAERLLRDGSYLTLRRGCLVAVGGGGDAVDRAFRAVTCPTNGPRANVTVVLQPTLGARPMLIDLCPLPAAASGPLALGQVLLTVRERPSRPDAAALLRDTFALTAAESDIAMMLADGLSLADIATVRGARIATTRTQVKALFEKTGSRRQTELALLVNRFR